MKKVLQNLKTKKPLSASLTVRVSAYDIEYLKLNGYDLNEIVRHALAHAVKTAESIRTQTGAR